MRPLPACTHRPSPPGRDQRPLPGLWKHRDFSCAHDFAAFSFCAACLWWPDIRVSAFAGSTDSITPCLSTCAAQHGSAASACLAEPGIRTDDAGTERPASRWGDANRHSHGPDGLSAASTRCGSSAVHRQPAGNVHTEFSTTPPTDRLGIWSITATARTRPTAFPHALWSQPQQPHSRLPHTANDGRC